MQVILSDGDLLTLDNMKLNLELNQLSIEPDVLEISSENLNMVSSSYGSLFLSVVTIFPGRQLIISTC